MSGRGWWSAGIGIAVIVGLAAPVAAQETTFDDTCADVYGERPVGDLEKSTDPVAGSSVVPGHRVTVTVSWPTFAVAGERNHRVMECVSIDGGEPQLWAEHTFTTAEDTVTLSAAVPAGSRRTVCSQTFLKTEGSFGPVTRWSEKSCFPVGQAGTFTALARSPSPKDEQREPESRSTPTSRPPLFSRKTPPSQSSASPPSRSGDYRAPWPPWEEAPPVASAPRIPSTTTTTAARAAASKPRQQAGEQVAAAAQPASTQAPSQTLPKTGAGIVVLMGVAAVALFSGRTLRKTAHHIEDNLPVEAVPIDDDEPTLILGRRW